MGLLGSAFPLSFSKTQALLQQLVGVEMSRGAIARVRQRLSAALAEPMDQALAAARQQPVAYVDETGAPTGNAVDEVLCAAVGNNPTGKRGWQWVMVTAVVTVFVQGLSRSTAAAIELLGSSCDGIVVSDRFSAYNHPPLEQRQLCWAHLIRDLTAIAERPGASTAFVVQLLRLQRQLFGHWHRYIEPTNNAAERALRQSVIQRKISHGVQSASGAVCCSRLLTVTTTLRHQGQDVWEFLEQAWISHHRGGVMPSLLPDP